jgi:hypothetical protein
MKRKELKDYIRTEIINELSLEEEAVAWNTANKNKAKQQIEKSKLSGDAKKEAKDEIDQNPSGLISNVSEMARHRKNIKIGDQEKFDEALDLYGTNTIEGKILQMVQDAGENGTTQEDMAVALNTSTSVLNPRIKEFETADVFDRSNKNIDTTDLDFSDLDFPDVDEPEIDEPETEEPEIEEPEEEESETKKAEEDDFPIEFEPSTADIKNTEKEFGGEYGKKLSPEDEERYQTLRKGIEAKIKRLADMSPSERAKSLDLQVLKKWINAEDIKKLFKDKGVSLKDLIGDVIG